MKDKDLLRYSRQIFLPEIDIAGQQKINDAKIIIIGIGGLGSPIAMYLAAAGVGALTIADYDMVEISNLQRQILYTQNDIDNLKVIAAAARLQAINADIKVNTISEKLDHASAKEVFANHDIIIDASDNFATRYAINKLAVMLKKPLISGAAISWQGQLAVFNGHLKDYPCYNCIFPEKNNINAARCSETGVLGPIVGIIGSMQALLAIKLIVGMSISITLWRYDAKTMNFIATGIKKDKSCTICN